MVTQMFLNARQLKFSLKNEVNIEKFKTLFLSTFSRALRELVISTQHLYYSEIQSSETFLPAGLIIHLQQQPISLFRLTTSDLFQLSTVLQRDIAGKSYLFSQCPPVLKVDQFSHLVSLKTRWS